MAKFMNVDGITEIKIDGAKVKCFCPIGKSVCTYQIGIHARLSTMVPDYLEVGEMIADMEGQEYTLEAAASHVWDWMEEYIDPYDLVVTVYCDDAKHMPVTVVCDKNADEI